MTTSPARRAISLTGIKPTGVPHLGNYVGAIRPAIALAADYDAYYFIADYHALIGVRDPRLMDEYTRSVAATWIACGLDPERTVFYRQSDVPETFELQWVFSCLTAKGMMNRAHAYKAAVDRNRAAGESDLDAGIDMGLYNYPVLMAADIVVMEADVVPVGRDQIQHVEYARDIVERFNQAFGAGHTLTVPRHVIDEAADANTMPGLDGRKMSKSYGNTIPLFASTGELKKLLKKLKTDSTPLEAPKDPDGSSLYAIYRQFASADQAADLRARMLAGGLGWGHIKDELHALLDDHLREPRERYAELIADRAGLDAILRAGAERARERARQVVGNVRRAVGIDA
ncbi:MAG TPA: tryptophan--tRNA ligase [Miltoncostaeaceae bacterium]|nr:tryptophan--tRNA ligase [Miltoncostaeaceae bacterium]